MQRPELDGLIERITRDNLPMVEGREAEGLALRVIPQVHLEAEALYDGQVGFDNKGWSSRFRVVCGNVPSPLPKNGVNSCYAVCKEESS